MSERDCIVCIHRMGVLKRDGPDNFVAEVCAIGESLYANRPCKYERPAVAVIRPKDERTTIR
jgi:hypothetical protein